MSRSAKKQTRGRRGNALVLAVALVAILAIMGSTFVMVARMDREAVRGIATVSAEEAALELILAQIKSVLAEDVIGRPEGRVRGLLGKESVHDNDGDGEPAETHLNLLAEPTVAVQRANITAAIDRPDLGKRTILNEPWDYPSHGYGVDPVSGSPSAYTSTVFDLNAGDDDYLGTWDDKWIADDKWLASTEPDATTTPPRWRHVTDLDGQIAEMAFPSVRSGIVFLNKNGGRDITGDPLADDFTAGMPARMVDPDNRNYIKSGPVARVPDKFQYVGDPADADGDGVTDSRWVKCRVGFTRQSPTNPQPIYLRTPEGHDVYMALRIIDNGSLLNLNTSYGGDATPDGADLTDINHVGWRGNATDRYNLFNLRVGKDKKETPQKVDIDTYNEFLLRLTDVPGKLTADERDEYTTAEQNLIEKYCLFNFSEEMEMRHRYFLNGTVQHRFEGLDGWAVVFDRSTAEAFRRRTPFDPRNDDDMLSGEAGSWAWFLDPMQDKRTAQGVPQMINTPYDRRHLCTFYSWDRTFRRRYAPSAPFEESKPAGVTAVAFDPDPGRDRSDASIQWVGKSMPPYPNPADLRYLSEKVHLGTVPGKELVHALFSFRAYFLEVGYDKMTAARNAAQVIAHLIDRSDANNSPVPEQPTLLPVQNKDEPTVLSQQTITKLINTTEGVALAPGDAFVMKDLMFSVVGYERQPFITAVWVRMDDEDSGGDPPKDDTVDDWLVELYNPYDEVLSLENWRLQVGGGTETFGAGVGIPANDWYFVAYTAGNAKGVPGISEKLLATMNSKVNATGIKLLRPILRGTKWTTVDHVRGSGSGSNDGTKELTDNRTPEDVDKKYDRILLRNDDDDEDGAYARANMELTGPSANVAVAGAPSVYFSDLGVKGGGPNEEGIGELMPLASQAGDVMDTVEDFLELLLIGHRYHNNETGQKPITEEIDDIDGNQQRGRFDLVPYPPGSGGPKFTGDPAGDDQMDYVSVLDYVTVMMKEEEIKRGPPTKGNMNDTWLYSDLRLHGRVNVNTAPPEVLMRVLEPFAKAEWGGSNVAEEIVYGDGSSVGLLGLRANPLVGTLPSGVKSKPQRVGHVGLANVSQLLDLEGPKGFDVIASRDFTDRYKRLGNVYNLLTTRTDVVTAYILVRIQQPGGDEDDLRNDTIISQKRYVAVFDRSGVFRSPRSPAIDGIDNDGDGKIDADDDNEDPAYDGIDNDGDGKKDDPEYGGNDPDERDASTGVRLIGLYHVPGP